MCGAANESSTTALRGPIGIVIAHPDDESMFFTPALGAMQRAGHHTFLLCLSSGNYYGLGETRKRELLKAATVLGVREEDVTIIEDEDLQDGCSKPWPAEVIASRVRVFVQEHGINTLLTFDEQGVSGHADHAAVHRGVALYLRIHANSRRRAGSTLGAFVLESTGFLRKYAGLLDLPWSLATSRLSPSGAFYLNFSARKAWRAMAAHRSQFVWYRRLFVVFSRYAYVNTFKRLQAAPSR